MRTSRRRAEGINTGSMADIAFLLLIFFLVSTTISAEKGIIRKLPPNCSDIATCRADIKDRNLMVISINRNNEIMISNDVTSIDDVQNSVKSFIDNNGLGNCDYCNGTKISQFSEHPFKAIISLNYDTQSSYNTYVKVQDEIEKAYNNLRQTYANYFFGKPLSELNKNEIQIVKNKYPKKVSETTTNITL